MNTRDRSPLRPELPITDAVKAEVLRRREALEQHRESARPWPQILAEQRRKLAGPH